MSVYILNASVCVCVCVVCVCVCTEKEGAAGYTISLYVDITCNPNNTLERALRS